MQVNIHEAKTQLSRLLQKVAEGEEVTIARAGKPVARLVAVPPQGKRPLGLDRGKIWIADDFDAPDPEFEDLFYNGPIFPDESGNGAIESRKREAVPSRAKARKAPARAQGKTANRRSKKVR
jgi:prevent-host-death family protein